MAQFCLLLSRFLRGSKQLYIYLYILRRERDAVDLSRTRLISRWIIVIIVVLLLLLLKEAALCCWIRRAIKRRAHIVEAFIAQFARTSCRSLGYWYSRRFWVFHRLVESILYRSGRQNGDVFYDQWKVRIIHTHEDKAWTWWFFFSFQAISVCINGIPLQWFVNRRKTRRLTSKSLD